MTPIQQLLRIARNAKSHALYNYFPAAIDWAVNASTFASRKQIVQAGASRLLVDNTVVAHAVTHETGWISTGTKMWGGTVPVETGYSARNPVHDENDRSEAARSVRYLAGIASLARHGTLALFSSPELFDEQMTQPIGRYRGYGYYDHSLFSSVTIERLPDPTYTMTIGPGYLGIASMEEQRHKRLASKADPLFKALVQVLGPNNSQDAWHIATAEHHNCYCFLTMDFRLIKSVEAQGRNSTVSALKTKVMSPEKFGKTFGLMPVSPRLFSYHGASYPVCPELNWPDSKRRKRSSYRSAKR